MDQKEKEEQEIRRLWWHSRRGMLELDGLLLPFTENKFRDLNDGDKQLYRRLIDSEDQDLFDWFMGKSKCSDEELQRIIGVVLDYARNG